MIRGADYSFGRPSPAALAAAGVRFVVRYIPTGSGKDVTRGEYDALVAAGIDVALVYEANGGAARGGYKAGVAAGNAAWAAVSGDNLPSTGREPVYFAVDFDAGAAADTLAAAVEYIRGAASVLGYTRTGVYGGERVVKTCLDRRVCAFAWQTYAWTTKWDTRAHLRQTGQTVIGRDLVDVDFATVPYFGQWPAPSVPPKPTPANIAAVGRASAESAHPTQNFAGLCDHAVAWYYGLAHSGSTSAREHWHAIPANRKHSPAVPAVAGGLHFFGNTSDTGNWHVTLAAGDGKTNWTTDEKRAGKVDRTTVAATAKWCGLTHLGWADPVFPGAGADFGVLTPELPVTKPTRGAYVYVPSSLHFPALGQIHPGAGPGRFVQELQHYLGQPVTGVYDKPTVRAVRVKQARALGRYGLSGVVSAALYRSITGHL